jgi:hypothetical protein
MNPCHEALHDDPSHAHAHAPLHPSLQLTRSVAHPSFPGLLAACCCSLLHPLGTLNHALRPLGVFPGLLVAFIKDREREGWRTFELKCECEIQEFLPPFVLCVCCQWHL